MDYSLYSKPDWLKDKGNGRVTIRGLTMSMKLIPYTNSDGKLGFNFSEDEASKSIEMEDYQVELEGQSDFPRAFQYFLNNFKDFFKVEVAYLLTDSASRAF